jgi:hypothetical protein
MIDDHPVASPGTEKRTVLPGTDSTTHPSAVSMDVLSLLRLLGRHWRVAVPAALLTLLGVVAALRVSSPTYNATGSIVLLNPAEAPEQPETGSPPEVGQNPFTRYGDIAIVTNILTRMMNSDSMRGELASHGVAGYDIVASPSGRDPVFEVTGQGPDADTAVRSTEIVLAQAEKSLSEVQQEQGADPDYFIRSAPLEPPSAATAVYGSTMRSAIAVFAFGGLCTLGLAVLAEVIARRRADRGTTAAPGSEDSHDALEGFVPAGSNGSAEEGSAAAGAQPEGFVPAGSNGSAEEGPAAAGAAGEVDKRAGWNGSFDSTGIIVPDSPRQRVREGGSSGSPAWGRAAAPLGRRPHRWSPPPSASNGSGADEGRPEHDADR